MSWDPAARTRRVEQFTPRVFVAGHRPDHPSVAILPLRKHGCVKEDRGEANRWSDGVSRGPRLELVWVSLCVEARSLFVRLCVYTHVDTIAVVIWHICLRM